MFICSSISKTCGPPMDYDYQFEDWSSCIKRGGELIVEFVDQIEINMSEERLYVSYFCGNVKLNKSNG